MWRTPLRAGEVTFFAVTPLGTLVIGRAPTEATLTAGGCCYRLRMRFRSSATTGLGHSLPAVHTPEGSSGTPPQPASRDLPEEPHAVRCFCASGTDNEA